EHDGSHAGGRDAGDAGDVDADRVAGRDGTRRAQVAAAVEHAGRAERLVVAAGAEPAADVGDEVHAPELVGELDRAVGADGGNDEVRGVHPRLHVEVRRVGL